MEKTLEVTAMTIWMRPYTENLGPHVFLDRRQRGQIALLLQGFPVSVLVFETGSLVAQAGLELNMQLRLALNS